VWVRWVDRILGTAPGLSCGRVPLSWKHCSVLLSAQQQKLNNAFFLALLVRLDLERIDKITEFMKGANTVLSDDPCNPLPAQEGNMI